MPAKTKIQMILQPQTKTRWNMLGIYWKHVAKVAIFQHHWRGSRTQKMLGNPRKEEWIKHWQILFCLSLNTFHLKKMNKQKSTKTGSIQDLLKTWLRYMLLLMHPARSTVRNIFVFSNLVLHNQMKQWLELVWSNKFPAIIWDAPIPIINCFDCVITN